jgi:pSer/pThr/pTyr-binding forkhead associated (FHA) protein
VASAAAWEVVVAVDAALDTEPDPATPCPVGEPERAFPLDLAENLIGRRDDRRDIKPEIPVNDPGASRRHAKLLRQADGTVALHDLASVNGTRVNGEEVPAGTRRTLRPGDVVTLGRWTRLTLRARS